MKKIISIFLMTTIVVSVYGQLNKNLKLVKPIINFNDTAGGFYSDYYDDALETFFCGAIVENQGMVSATNVSLEINLLDYYDNENQGIFSSDTIECIKPGQIDTIPMFEIQPATNYGYRISYDIKSDSVDEYKFDNVDTLPAIQLWGNMWSYVRRSNDYNSRVVLSDIEGFGSGDFIGITLRVPAMSFHVIAEITMLVAEEIPESITVKGQVYRNGTLIRSDSVRHYKANEVHEIISYNEMNVNLFLDSTYFIGFEFNSFENIQIPILVDTMKFHNFHTETIARINGEWTTLDFIPLITLICDPEGVEDSRTSRVHIFPNPMVNSTLIQSSGNHEITLVSIYNINGLLVRVEKVNAYSYNLNRKGLKQGMYFLKCDFKNQKSEIKKLILE